MSGMRIYKIDVRQNLYAIIDGTIEIKARSPREAINKLRVMSEKKIEKSSEWKGCIHSHTEIGYNSESIIEV